MHTAWSISASSLRGVSDRKITIKRTISRHYVPCLLCSTEATHYATPQPVIRAVPYVQRGQRFAFHPITGDYSTPTVPNCSTSVISPTLPCVKSFVSYLSRAPNDAMNDENATHTQNWVWTS